MIKAQTIRSKLLKYGNDMKSTKYEKKDKKADKKAGIKENSKKDKAIDKKMTKPPMKKK